MTNAVLNWSETTAGVTGFNVYRGTVQTGPFTKIASPTAMTYTDPSLAPGTYYYYITSVLTVESTPSGTVSATIAAGAPPLTVSSSNFPNGIVGNAYTGGLTITGGVPPYTYSATGVPGGLSVSTSTGALTGTPTTAATDTTNYSIHDSAGTPATITPSFTYMIAAAPPPPPPTPPAPPPGVAGTVKSASVVLTWTASVSPGVTRLPTRAAVLRHAAAASRSNPRHTGCPLRPGRVPVPGTEAPANEPPAARRGATTAGCRRFRTNRRTLRASTA